MTTRVLFVGKLRKRNINAFILGLFKLSKFLETLETLLYSHKILDRLKNINGLSVIWTK